MRFLKYVGGEYFRPHCDGCYETPDRKERSYVTVHLYLNSAVTDDENDYEEEDEDEDEDQKVEDGEEPTEEKLTGGVTTFRSFSIRQKLDVTPKTGRILLFSQRDLLHSGDDMLSDVKYTMRTELMYALEKSDGSGRQERMWMD